MGKRTTTVVAALGATALLVVGVEAVSHAANGSGLILGKNNKASKVTKVTRTKAGPVLNLKAKKKSSPPFKTNARGKVKNLNADKVDGINGTKLKSTADSALAKAESALATGDAALEAAESISALRLRDPMGSRSGNTTYAIGTIPAGTYLATFNASVDVNGAAWMSCSLRTVTTSPIFSTGTRASGSAAAIDDVAAPSFSNILVVDGSENFTLRCTTSNDNGWEVTPVFLQFGQAPTLSLTRLAGHEDGVLSTP